MTTTTFQVSQVTKLFFKMFSTISKQIIVSSGLCETSNNINSYDFALVKCIMMNGNYLHITKEKIEVQIIITYELNCDIKSLLNTKLILSVLFRKSSGKNKTMIGLLMSKMFLLTHWHLLDEEVIS